MNQENRRQVILNFLGHEGPMTLRTLSAKCGIDQSTLQRDLDWLVAAEIVARNENPSGKWFKAKAGLRFTYKLRDAA